MSQEILGVDAFCGEQSKGNLAGVCVTHEALSETLMQSLAKNFGASETAFLVLGEAPLSLRWFTPSTEVALCGHGTLATAYVLWEKGIFKNQQELSFKTLSGILGAKLLENKRIELRFPELKVEPAHVSKNVMEALGIQRPLFIGLSDKYVLVEVENESVLRSLKPDFVALKKVVQRGFLITTKSESKGFDFLSRCFFPKEGIPEDPVTGSAHCVLGPYWKRKLAKQTLVAYQASAEGGELEIAFEKGQVLLRGFARFSLLKN